MSSLSVLASQVPTILFSERTKFLICGRGWWLGQMAKHSLPAHLAFYSFRCIRWGPLGLALGGLLHKAGIPFDIFEKAPTPRTVGPLLPNTSVMPCLTYLSFPFPLGPIVDS